MWIYGTFGTKEFLEITGTILLISCIYAYFMRRK